MVTRMGLESLPPQSVATTLNTWLRDSCADSGTVLRSTPFSFTENGWSGVLILDYQKCQFYKISIWKFEKTHFYLKNNLFHDNST